jgi:hypothetical protein
VEAPAPDADEEKETVTEYLIDPYDWCGIEAEAVELWPASLPAGTTSKTTGSPERSGDPFSTGRARSLPD